MIDLRCDAGGGGRLYEVTGQGPVGVPLKQEVVVTAGQQAEVTATPTGALTLSCRVLLDLVKELAKATAPVGWPGVLPLAKCRTSCVHAGMPIC